MKIANTIKKVFGGMLKDYGFEYFNYVSGVWTFRRKYNEVDQFVFIQNGSRFSEVRLGMYTSVILPYLRVEDIQPNWKEKYPKMYQEMEYWGYNDLETLEGILKQFAQTVIEYGIDALNEHSKPTRWSIRKSIFEDGLAINNILFNDHEALCNQFIKKYNLSLENFYEGIDKIVYIITNELIESDKEIINKTLEMAAYLAEAYRYKYGGKWVIEEKFNICGIMLKKRIYNPLSIIITAWINLSEDTKSEEIKDFLINDFK